MAQTQNKNPEIKIDDRLKEAYTDLNGNKYFEFIDDGLMTYKRFISAQITERFIRLGLTPEFLKLAIEQGLNICYDKAKTEQKKMEDFSAIFLALKARAGYVSTEDQYLRLACVYFLLPGEPVDHLNEMWTLKKIAMMDENPDAKDFFLQSAFTKIYSLLDFSIADMHEYLQMANLRQQTAPILPG